MDGLLNALTIAIIWSLWSWNISGLGAQTRSCDGSTSSTCSPPAGVLLLLVPAHMLACNQIRCKNMRTYCDQTFFKCKPSLNMLSLCGACDAPTSPCACIASAASSCGHCKQQSHTKMIPAPIEGKGGGGQNQPFECLFLLLGNPGMMIHPTTSNISNGILT